MLEVKSWCSKKGFRECEEGGRLIAGQKKRLQNKPLVSMKENANWIKPLTLPSIKNE